MPTYCYERKDTGEVLELVMTIAEMEARQNENGEIILEDGVSAFRNFNAELGGFRYSAGTWPMYSDACGVHESQIGEAYAASVRKGVPTEFDSIGRAIFRDKGHRKRYCEAYGYFDRNAGFGDPQKH